MINDPIFGEMSYKHRWFKEEQLELWGQVYTVKIVAKAYKEKPITSEQQESYKRFVSNLAVISEETKHQLTTYMQQCLPSEHDIHKSVVPKTVLFKQDGETIILCECTWDYEHGIGIRIFPEYEVGPQEIFL